MLKLALRPRNVEAAQSSIEERLQCFVQYWLQIGARLPYG